MDLASQIKAKTSFLENVKLYRRLVSYVMVYKWVFFTGIAFVILFSLTTPGVAALMKPLLDGSFVERDPVLIFWSPILLVVLFALRGLASYLNLLCFSWVTSRVVYNIQVELIERTVCLPAKFYDQNSTGQIISRIATNVESLMAAASTALITMVRESITILGLLVWIFIIDWVLSLIIVVSTPLVVYLVQVVARRLRVLHRHAMHQNAVLLQHLQEVTANHRLVKIYRTAHYELGRLTKIANDVRQLKFKLAVANGLTVPIAEFISTVAIAFTIYFTLNRDLTNPLTVGSFVSFMAALALITSSMKRLIRINNILQSGLTAAERVFFLMDQQTEIETGDRLPDRDAVRGHIAYKNVSFQYPSTEISSIKNISLQIKPCQTIALVGSSGSGKTTLTSLLPRLYELQEGGLEIDGVDIRNYRIAALRDLISYVSQDIFLFNDTIYANIAYGNVDQATRGSVHDAAVAAHAMEFIQELPDGFETIVGERGIRLSGGQKQRIAIARAFIKDAPILVFDEATSALDTQSEYQVRAAVETLGRDRTVIIIAHRLSSIEYVDRIAVMSDGEIVEDGNHDELMALKGHYYDLYTVFQRSPQSE